MSIRARLTRLERSVGDAACPACRDRRGRVVKRTGRELADGTVRLEEPGPAPCPRCGEVPEEVVTIIEVVVETREDLARWQARADAGGEGTPA